MAMNHMNLEGLQMFVEDAKKDLSKAKKSKKVECSWNFEEGKSQIESKVQHPKGETILRSDFAPFTTPQKYLFLFKTNNLIVI